MLLITVLLWDIRVVRGRYIGKSFNGSLKE